MDNNNQVCRVARINFYSKPIIQFPVILVEQNKNEAALYADDNFEHEYCMNTTAWD